MRDISASVGIMLVSDLFGKKSLNLRKLCALAAVCLVAACGKDDEDTYVARDVDVLYNLGADYRDRGRYKLAAAAFDEVERQHPYSIWAKRAQLQAAYSHYQAQQYDDSVLSAQRFLQLHPGSPSAPYAYYLIAVSQYEQIGDVRRDGASTEAARESLLEVIRRYPDSEYARDARLKLDLTLDHLAGKDMEVGRFYLSRREYLAASQRFRNVIKNFQSTSHVPEALHRMVEVSLALGVELEAQQTAAVLGHNFPDSKWYKYSYDLLTNKGLRPTDDGGNWLSDLWPF